MWKIARFLKDYKKEVILGPLFKLIEAVLELMTPLIMARMIDVGIRGGNSRYVLLMGSIMLAIAAVSYASALVCQYYASRASQGYGTTVRNKLFAHINTLSHREIDALGTPSLITRLTNDINQLQLAVAMLIRLVIRAPFLALGAIVMSMLIDLKLSLLFLSATFLIVLILYVITSRSVPYFRSIQSKVDQLARLARENLSGARVIRAFARQEAEHKRFSAAAADASNTFIHVGRLSALLNPLTSVTVSLATAAILWFGGSRVYGGSLTQGQLIALISYMTQILLALIVVVNLVVLFTRAAASAVRVNEVFDTQPAVSSEVQTFAVPVQKNAHLVKFSHVSFAYKGEYALEDISLQIERGETIGIIGGTGSGKSTLVHLIPRFYDASKGSVQVDGLNVKDYDLSQLRARVGMVMQNTALFNGSIRENLFWGKSDATDEDIRRALTTAQAIDFVDKLPEGLDSVIREGGRNLSGGQRQRLTIARALIRPASILILDDSFSSLDFATEAALHKALRKDAADRTLIIVSQRTASIRHADKIVVMDDGRIVGIGTHEVLLSTSPLYREIHNSQTQPEEAS